MANENPFALVVLTAKTALSGRGIKNSLERDKQLLDLKIELAKQLLNRQIPKEKIRVLMNFLRYYTRFENPEIHSKFEQAVEVLTERNTTMGIEELLLDRAKKQGLKAGIEKGIEKGSHDKAVAVAKEMIKDGISVEQIAKFTKLTVGEIETLRLI